MTPTDPPITTPSPSGPDALSSAPIGAGAVASAPPGEPQAPRLSLTDFLDIRTLQELQDSFASLTQYATTIQDADGRQVTAPTDPAARGESNRVLDWLMADEATHATDTPLVAPIIVEGQALGSITIDPKPSPRLAGGDALRFRRALESLKLEPGRIDELVTQGLTACGPSRAAGVQFVYLMANSIARLCYQEFQLRKRIDELATLYTLSTTLAQQENLQHVLDTAAREAAETFGVKAVSIRLLDEQRRELRIVSVHNLSKEYLAKGPLTLERSPVFQQALKDGLAYVADMATDSRVVYPDNALREGLTSLLCAGIVFKDAPIGVIQLYSVDQRQFSRWETDLLKAMAQLLATAIRGADLENKRRESRRVERQLRMAVDVQKRMLPSRTPILPHFELASKYVPSSELGGDLYDFIDLADNLGVAIADVAGKGIAASLLMSAVRSYLRAFTQDLYDLDTIVSRINVALCRDTHDYEFATLFYGVLDPRTRRLTYCNAGHEPGLLLRHGNLIQLEAGGMAVGVDPSQTYSKGVFTFETGDSLLLYTDGLMDAQNFEGQRFGRDRIRQAFTATSGLSAQETANHVLWSMRRFAGLNTRTDDTTLVVLRCTG